MTRIQGWLIVGLLAFLCVHVLGADMVGVYLYSQIGDSSPTVITDTATPDITDGKTPLCDPEGDVCP